MRLVLAEHDYQVEDFLERLGPEDLSWVALGPSAMHLLTGKGLNYTIPEDYCSRLELQEVCESHFEDLSRLCQDLDAVLLEKSPFLAHWGIRPFFFHLWQLGQLTDILIGRSLQLHKILKQFPGAEVYVHLASPQSWEVSNLGFYQKETLWGRLLALPCFRVKLHAFPDPVPRDSGVRGNSSGPRRLRVWRRGIDFLASRARKTPMLYTLGFSWRQGWQRNILNILRPGQATKSSLAILNGLYEWTAILPQVLTDGSPVYFLSGTELLKAAATAAADTPEAGLPVGWWEDFQQNLPVPLRDVAPIIQDRFAFITNSGTRVAQAIIRELEEFASQRSVAGLLFSSGADFGTAVAKQYCQEKGLPVLGWQHGAAWFDRRATQRTDLFNLVGCNQFLVFGEGVKQGFETSPLAERQKCEIVSVGMPSLRRLRRISPARAISSSRILWPFCGYYCNAWYCGFSPPFSDTVYYQEQMVILRSLLQMLRKYPELSVTIKLYPSKHQTDQPPWVGEALRHKRVSAVYDYPNFVGLLPDHDLVIIDCPTTTLLQSAATKLPVFTLMSVMRWPDKALDLLRKRAVCAENAASLVRRLGQFLEKGIYDPEVENDDFLRDYGIFPGDGPDIALSLVKKALLN